MMRMMMNDSCCQPKNVNDLNNRFDQAKAEEAAKDYADEGLSARGEKLIAYLDTETPGFGSVLDIGCGVGALHQEMLQRGLVRKAVGVDASAASLENAAKNSEAQALSEKTQYIEGDFALQPDIAKAADVVVMDRVVCCYPELEPLLVPAADKAKHYLLLSYPRDSMVERFIFFLSRLEHIATRSKFRLYYHEPKKIKQLVEKAGFRSVHEDREGEWQLSVYERVDAH
jgi:magnesium-protoporphyrin O-methyltransferase